MTHVLTSLSLRVAVALALEAQMVREGEEIPTNEWDRLPEVLLTPEGELS
jgi:5-formyltetrahydrofolate cyclo-ligase